MKNTPNFYLKSRGFTLGLLMLVSGLFSADLSAQTIRTIVYRPNTIFTIKAGVGIATQIEISPKEKVLDYGTGFSSAWEIVRRDNVFYIKPKSIDADTNMTIRTSKRVYLLELTVAAKRWKNLAQMKKRGTSYRVKFVYPSDSHAKKNRRFQSEFGHTASYSKNLNYDYAATESSSWLVPQTVYDDGRFTFIQLNDGPMPDGGMPAVYGKKSIKSGEFIVNSKSKGRLITVFGIYKYLVLRHGNNVVGLRRNSQSTGVSQ